MMEVWIGVAAALVGLIATAAVLITRRDKLERGKRTAELGEAATAMSLTFVDKAPEPFFDRVKHFKLFRSGGGKKVFNLATGRPGGDLELSTFDYHFTVNTGQSSMTYRTTVLLLESPSLGLPKAVIRRRRWFDALRRLVGRKEVRLLDRPEMDRALHVRGDDHPRIAQMLTDQTLDTLGSDFGMHIETDGAQFIYYKTGKRVSAEQLPDFVKRGLEIMTALRNGL